MTLPLFDAYLRFNLLHAQNNLFSSQAWQRVLHQTYGLKLFCKFIEEEGALQSYIIYSVVHNFLEWKICVGSYCDYLDNQVQHPDHWHHFFEAIREEYPRYRIAVRNLKDASARSCADLKLLSKEKHHEIDLRDALDVIWRETPATFKKAYKKSLTGDLTFRRCDRTHLPEFYRLHLRLRKNKYRIFPQPYRFFVHIWEEFMNNDRGVLLGAFNNRGEMVAGQVFLIAGKTLFYKFSASHPQDLHQKPNNLLIWEGIKYAKEKGLQRLDLGSSAVDQDGLIWFKTHIAKRTIERDIHHLGFAPPEYRFSRKRILKAYTGLLTSPLMPDLLVKFGSNLIYPYLA